MKIRDYKTNRTNLTRHRSGDVPGDLGREELLQTGSPSVGADCGARAVDLHHFRLLRRRAEGRVDVHGLQVGVVQEHFVGAVKKLVTFSVLRN